MRKFCISLRDPQIRPHFAGSEVKIPVISVGNVPVSSQNRDRGISESKPPGGTSIDLQRSRQSGTLPPSWLLMGIVALECIGFMCHFVWQDRYHGKLGFN